MVTRTPTKRIGSPASVYHGTALMTPGGITKAGLIRIRQSDGSYRIRFKAAHEAALRRWKADAGLRAQFAPYTKPKKRTTRRRTVRRAATTQRKRARLT